jgi:hypothetical protein
MNTQERSFYNNVTGFSVATIKRIQRKVETATEKFWTLKAELGKELMLARDYYNSEQGKTEMDDAGICYNDICDFFQTITNGQMKKGAAYKRIKVYENISDNNDAPKLFVKLVKETKAQNPSAKIVQSDEGFNYFCANGELKIKGETSTSNQSNASEVSESGDAEESESEENQSEESGTKFSFSMKATNGESGACIRMNTGYEVIAEDGDNLGLKIAMIKYLTDNGYEVNRVDE